MRQFALSILFLGCFSFSPAEIRAQVPSGSGVSVTGNVMDAGDNRRVEGATVRLCDGEKNLIEQTVTSSSGDFWFRRLKRGTYVLTVTADGFQPQEVHVDLSFSSERGFTIYLNALPTKSAPGSSGPSVSTHELSLPESARESLASGRKALYVEKNPSSALGHFDQALKKAPGSYEAAYEKGMAYLFLKNTPDAMHSFRESIKLSGGKYGDAQIALGTLLLDQGQWEEGEKYLRQGVARSPGSWMGFYQLAKLEIREDSLAEAETSAGQARSLEPNDPRVYQLLSLIHLRLKNYPALLQDIDDYLQLDSTSPAAVRAKEVRQQVQQQIAHSNPAAMPAPRSAPQDE